VVATNWQGKLWVGKKISAYQFVVLLSADSDNGD
jgi:hypothetical protein